MKKANDKGFMLTETLIVATMLITVLLVLYIQFKNVNRSYEQTFKYNTVNDLYSLYNAKKYIEKENYVSIASRLNSSDYVEITDCSQSYFSNPSYCIQLMNNLEIKQLLFTKENVKKLKKSNTLDSDFNDYIKTIKTDNSSAYRLIAKFKNNTYATIKLLNGEKYVELVENTCALSNKVEFTINHKLEETNEDVANPTVKKQGCGSPIISSNFDYYDKCLYVSSYSKPTFNISLDPTANQSTIFYKKYTSNLTIYYVNPSDYTTQIDTPLTIEVPCGTLLNIDQYKKNIPSFSFVLSSYNEILKAKDDESVTLYYEAGEDLYE